jgi:hypothetical protein
MSEIIFKTDGKETSRISPLTDGPVTVGTKCPETKLEIKMTEIEKVKGEIKVLQAKLALLEEMENYKTPVEEAYKDAYGYYPDMEYNMNSFSIFQKGYEAAQEDAVVNGPYCPDDSPEYDEVEWDEKDNPKPMDEVVNRLVKKYQAQKLWNIMRDKLGFSIDMCDEIVDLVESWLPQEQSSAGSQNVDTELLVDGHNHCLQKMKEMLR